MLGIISFGRYGLTAKTIKTYQNKKYMLEYPTPICIGCFDFVFEKTANELCSNSYGVIKKSKGAKSTWIIACRDSWGWYDKNLRDL